MSILEARPYYLPFHYPKAHEFFKTQDNVHWREEEFNMSKDLSDWNLKLSNDDKKIIGGILKGFVQAEVLVGDYWRNVARLFPHPEIAKMAACFSHFEGIHMDNYALLNKTLDLVNFEEFLQEPTTKNKLDYLVGKIENIHFTDLDKMYIKYEKNNLPEETKQKIKDLALSLAIFSGFTEGTLIFSSFGVLFAYSRMPYDSMKETAKIVEYSIRDENIHSTAGIWLFKELCNEFSWLHESIKEDLLMAALDIQKLEYAFIEDLFKDISILPINKEQLENFVNSRINLKLKEMNYSSILEENEILSKELEWFYFLTGSRIHGDFFAVTVSEYTKTNYTTDDLF